MKIAALPPRRRRAALAAARQLRPPSGRRPRRPAGGASRKPMLACAAVRRASAARRGAAGPRRRLLRRSRIGSPTSRRTAHGPMSRRRSRPRRPGRPIGEESWFGAFGSTGDTPSLIEDSRFAASWQAEPEASPSERRRPRQGDGRNDVRAHLPRLHRRARGARRRPGRVTSPLTGVFGLRPTPDGRRRQPRLCGAGDQHVAAAALAPRRRAASLRPAAQPAVDRDHRRRPGALHGAAPRLAGLEHQLRGAAGAAGADGRRADAARCSRSRPLRSRRWRCSASPGSACSTGGDATVLMTQAGLAGSGFFVITVLAGELAGRLAREELSARGSLELARQQAQLNRLVIEEMEDGVLVVDRGGKVRAANPAARRLLAPEGIEPRRRRSSCAACRPGARSSTRRAGVRRGRLAGGRPRRAAAVRARLAPDAARCACASRASASRSASEEFCVLFLEDVRNVQARSRQEKLAAMGRVSAGIAHEIRNPLAAIAQANALLAEDATDPAQRQLTQMVTENVERLKRIVDDVMEVAPGRVAGGRRDRRHGAGRPRSAASGRRPPASPLGERQRRCRLELPARAARRAVRRRAPAAGARQPARQRPPACERQRRARSWSGCWRADERGARRASACSATARRSRPTSSPICSSRFSRLAAAAAGLGLYICRELCERYGARIDYRLLPPGERAPQRVLRRHAPRRPAAGRRPHCTSPHDHCLALQPARRRRRARPAHAVRADAAARGLRPRHRRHGPGGAAASEGPHLQRRHHRHAPARRHRPRRAALARGERPAREGDRHHRLRLGRERGRGAQGRAPTTTSPSRST